MQSPALKYARVNSGINFQPDAYTVLWFPGQDDPQSATIRDRSGSGNNGTITGATWTRNGNGIWYLDFDGADDIVNIPDATSIQNVFDGGGSTVAWIYPESDGEGNLARILPANGGEAPPKFKPNELYTIPKDDQWFRLDDSTGKETIYLLASPKAIEDIDRRIEELKKSGVGKIAKMFPGAAVKLFTFKHK